MESSVLSILVGLWLMAACFGAAEEEPYVPAMYVFGDSLADAGNNNHIQNCQVRADFTPYGVSYFPNATGRFTNGRTAIDFIAARLGLPFPLPYLQPDANFTTGINFASGGSGMLDSTGADQNVLSMSHQVSLFEQYSDNLTGAAKANLGNSLFGIITGGNDITSYIVSTILGNNTSTPAEFITLMLTKIDEYIKRLYNHGARKFLVLNIPPAGCTPKARLLGILSNQGNCSESINELAEAYNTAFNSSVTQLNDELDGGIIQLNAYDVLMNVIQNGEAYGFSDTKSACCGWGIFNTLIGCGKTIPPDLYCNDTSTYVFWDGVHGTEKLYGMISEQIWSGNSSVMYPFNLSTLVSGETYLIAKDASTLSKM